MSERTGAPAELRLTKASAPTRRHFAERMVERGATDSDFVVLVTEPTPFGLHDVKLAVGAVGILGIPCGLVINRSDMGDDRLREYAGAEGIPILMEIPFDRKIAESYSRGELLVDVRPEWKEKFLQLYEKITDFVKQASQTGGKQQ